MSEVIALTGATGFVGTELAKQLVTTGRRIQALIRPASTWKRPANLGPQQRHQLQGSVDIAHVRDIADAQGLRA